MKQRRGACCTWNTQGSAHPLFHVEHRDAGWRPARSASRSAVRRPLLGTARGTRPRTTGPRCGAAVPIRGHRERLAGVRPVRVSVPLVGRTGSTTRRLPVSHSSARRENAPRMRPGEAAPPEPSRPQVQSSAPTRSAPPSDGVPPGSRSGSSCAAGRTRRRSSGAARRWPAPAAAPGTPCRPTERPPGATTGCSPCRRGGFWAGWAGGGGARGRRPPSSWTEARGSHPGTARSSDPDDGGALGTRWTALRAWRTNTSPAPRGTTACRCVSASSPGTGCRHHALRARAAANAWGGVTWNGPDCSRATGPTRPLPDQHSR